MSWDLDIRCKHCGHIAGDFNYTHNTNPMMRSAGAGPDDFNGLTVVEALPKLAALLAKLRSDPEKYRAFDADNGWGSYETLLPVLEKIEEAMKNSPADSLVSVFM